MLITPFIAVMIHTYKYKYYTSTQEWSQVFECIAGMHRLTSDLLYRSGSQGLQQLMLS